jgi:ElaB/YqjD/DUF883 family membrane-anchored ribosome-binding protein
MDGFMTNGHSDKSTTPPAAVGNLGQTAEDSSFTELQREFEQARADFMKLVEAQSKAASVKIQDNPWATVALATTAGVILGLLLIPRRSRTDRSVVSPMAQYIPQSFAETLPSISDRLAKTLENITNLDKDALSGLPSLDSISSFVKNMFQK